MGQYDRVRTEFRDLLTGLFKSDYLKKGHPDSSDLDTMVSIRVERELDLFESHILLRGHSRSWWGHIFGFCSGVLQSLLASILFAILLAIWWIVEFGSHQDPRTLAKHALESQSASPTPSPSP